MMNFSKISELYKSSVQQVCKLMRVHFILVMGQDWIWININSESRNYEAAFALWNMQGHLSRCHLALGSKSMKQRESEKAAPSRTAPIRSRCIESFVIFTFPHILSTNASLNEGKVLLSDLWIFAASKYGDRKSRSQHSKN